MSIYIGIGKYSNDGAEGLIDGSSDRRAAMEKLTKSVGAKLIDYHIWFLYNSWSGYIWYDCCNEFKSKSCRNS